MRNYSFDVVKFLGVLTIAVFHLLGRDISVGTIFIVDFLFALSGFFLVRKIDSICIEDRDAVKYTFTHAKKLFPYYFLSLIILFIYINRELIISMFSSYSSLDTLIYNFYKIIPELFYLQNIGIYTNGINYPLWQV